MRATLRHYETDFGQPYDADKMYTTLVYQDVELQRVEYVSDREFSGVETGGVNHCKSSIKKVRTLGWQEYVLNALITSILTQS